LVNVVAILMGLYGADGEWT